MRNNTSVEFDLDDRCDAGGARSETRPSPSRTPGKAVRRRQKALEILVATQVIPRLLVAHHVVSPLLPSVRANSAMLASRVGELSEVVVKADDGAAVAYIADLLKSATLEAIFQDLLAPTARRLGELWDEDINDFMDVTRGMAQLQLIVHTFGAELRCETGAPSPDRRALLVPVIGEQHTFGISLVSEHFRHQGWRVWSGLPQSRTETLELVSGQWFDAVGLSASRLADPASLSREIRELRQTSVNRRVAILVGGHAFDSSPELVSVVGADASGKDGQEALAHLTDSSQLQAGKLGR